MFGSHSSDRRRKRRLAALAVACLVAGHSPVAAQAQTAPPPDAEPLFEILRSADAAWRAGRHDEARSKVREAAKLAASTKFGQPVGAWWGVADAAYAVADLETADLALGHAIDHLVATSPDDPQVARMRMNRGLVKKELGDNDGALREIEPAAKWLAERLPPDDAMVLAAQLNLGMVLTRVGRFDDAAATLEPVWERVREDPNASPELVRVTQLNLGDVRFRLGEIRGALDLFEACYEQAREALPEHHPQLNNARNNLAETYAHVGDNARALELRQAVFASRLESLPADSLDLQAARNSLASSHYLLGDWVRARKLLEASYTTLLATVSPTHPTLQLTRRRLGILLEAIGDREGALAMWREVDELYSSEFGPIHPNTLDSCTAVAGCLRRLGRVDEAEARLRQAIDALPAPSDDESPVRREGRRKLRLSIAQTRITAGDPLAARDDIERVLAEWAADADHAAPVDARMALGASLAAAGDLDAVFALDRELYDASRATYGDADYDTCNLRRNLMWTAADRGDEQLVRELAALQVSALRRVGPSVPLAPRQIGSWASAHDRNVASLLTWTDGYRDVPAPPDLLRDALVVHELLRGIEIRAARARRSGAPEDDAEDARLQRELLLASSALRKWTDENGRSARAGYVDAFQARERLEREFAERAAARLPFDPATIDLDDLAARLPERAIAIVVARYEHVVADAENPVWRNREPRLVAFRVARDGSCDRVRLGDVAAVDGAVDVLRASVSTNGLARGGRRVRRGASAPAKAQAARTSLRAELLDPLEPWLGDDVDTVYLSLPESLQVVPLDGLESAGGDGAWVGDRVSLRLVDSLFDLLESPSPTAPDASPRLATLGAIDYGDGDEFVPLPGTAAEIEAVQALFADVHGDDARIESLRGDAVTAEDLIGAAAEDPRWLHVATHGWFATVTDSTPTDVDTLAPRALTGIALSNANAPVDDLGRRHGIVTAEELAQLDLSACRLVVLSACSTSLGARSAGRGYASLRAALRGAGAGAVLATLWPVGDDAAARLMQAFYRELWAKERPLHEALWHAKRTLRADPSVPYRDWAGWVLYGG